jgi:hypothetical protein
MCTKCSKEKFTANSLHFETIFDGNSCIFMVPLICGCHKTTSRLCNRLLVSRILKASNPMLLVFYRITYSCSHYESARSWEIYPSRMYRNIRTHTHTQTYIYIYIYIYTWNFETSKQKHLLKLSRLRSTAPISKDPLGSCVTGYTQISIRWKTGQPSENVRAVDGTGVRKDAQNNQKDFRLRFFTVFPSVAEPHVRF